MAKTSPAQQKAVHKYVKNNYDRLELSVPKGEKEKIKKAAIAAGQSVNNYIYIAVCHKMEQDAPGGELKITDTPSNQDKALSCSISPAQKKALEEVLCSIIQDTPRDQRDALKVELNQIICECTDKINKSKNTLSYPTLL